MMTYHEFLEPNDPRLVSTVRVVDDRLRQGFLVKRYFVSDDFGKSGSSFTICAFWLIDALYVLGETEKAQAMFDQLVKCSNHVGLFSEDIDVKTKKLLGNFPQAYTHLALINTAVLLSEWSVKRKKIDFSSLPVRKTVQ
jgi:GH15 family glucan-1,4-alpha-glucosidase